ncbi:hypothetical protein GJ697_25455 [Pseudoduganella sp. FT25W]|jgi:hypothetical protein|uniref:Uncharacterized protein n=1 Tax=Duganella alba TaxID=2666081 RepID=A0A6L5QMZ6_9BURK|nr:hypothetical protein [Duganella alba]MRX11176.1 hypothetical protein [Duganella alba]MRX19353.1 hypothetical protein [Duganella alba]
MSDLEIGLHASIVDSSTIALSQALRAPFGALEGRLKGEYGGDMEHLWISIDLVECTAKADGTPRHPFRFQKRVSGRSRFGLPAIPDRFNVGNFSVRPDFALLATMSEDQAIPYVLGLIYEGTSVLLAKQKKLGGFDAQLFRARFHAECASVGYPLDA